MLSGFLCPNLGMIAAGSQKVLQNSRISIDAQYWSKMTMVSRMEFLGIWYSFSIDVHDDSVFESSQKFTTHGRFVLKYGDRDRFIYALSLGILQVHH